MPLFDRFEKFLDQVIPPPDDVAASVRRGEALLAAGDAPGAFRLAEAATTAAPGFLRALTLKVDALAAMGSPQDALAVLDAAAQDRALPAILLGRMVEYAGAVGDEWRALDLEAHARGRLRGPDRAVGLRLLAGASALLARGAVTAGLRLARGATLADPSLGPAWLFLGRDALDRGDVALARRAFAKATVSLEPGDAPSNRLAGELAWKLGESGTAARLLRRAWIVGDETAFAPLVAVLAAGDDPLALERVLADAQGGFAEIARALVGLSRAQPDATEVLATVSALTVPEALWPWALDVALHADLAMAVRWACEAPQRAGSAAVLAVGAARSALDAGDTPTARRAIGPALDDALTRPIAQTLLREACERGWSGRLGVLLDELASIVRDAAPHGWEILEAELRARRRELDEPLRIVLLGEFSAGKSTFLNALVGAEVSPMGVLPTTAQVHWLRQGDLGARVVDLRGGVVETTIEEAPRTAARKRASGDEVDYVEVTLPLQRLGRLEVIDTPGFNAGEPAHEEAVRRAFDLADVGIWLFDTRQAGKQSEVGPMEEARARGLPIVGVLNKIDQATTAERSLVLSAVRDGFGKIAPCVMAISARGALAATHSQTDSSEDVRTAATVALHDSGWIDLMRYFDEQLIGRRSAWKQNRIVARVRGVVDVALDAMTRSHARAREHAEQYNALTEAVTSLRDAVLATAASVRREVALVLRDQLRGLRDERAADLDALVADAVAEIGYRARGRALEALRPKLREVERLGVAVGLTTAACGAILTAPIVQYLDLAVAEGVRDAQSLVPLQSALAGGVPLSPPLGFVPSDPLAALEAAAERTLRGQRAPADTLSIALHAAREVLSRFETPVISLPDSPKGSV